MRRQNSCFLEGMNVKHTEREVESRERGKREPNEREGEASFFPLSLSLSLSFVPFLRNPDLALSLRARRDGDIDGSSRSLPVDLMEPVGALANSDHKKPEKKKTDGAPAFNP
jgi:hypothetical protein